MRRRACESACPPNFGHIGPLCIRREVPGSDICTAANTLFDHLVGAGEQYLRRDEAECLSGLHVGNQLDHNIVGDTSSSSRIGCPVEYRYYGSLDLYVESRLDLAAVRNWCEQGGSTTGSKLEPLQIQIRTEMLYCCRVAVFLAGGFFSFLSPISSNPT
jgi:hypothetical protein